MFSHSFHCQVVFPDTSLHNLKLTPSVIENVFSSNIELGFPVVLKLITIKQMDTSLAWFFA